MRKVFVRTPYNYDARVAGASSALSCGDEEDDRCQQHFKDECDINTIVKRFGLTGKLPETFKAPMVGDFADVVDFQTAMNAVVDAKDAFMQMPADLRKRFGHDPQQLIEFLENKGNLEEARKLGLVPKPVERTRDVVQAVDELAAKIVPRETK